MTKPAKGKTLSFLAAAAALAAALPCAAAYVRGELVWECGFAPDEAERVGVAGLRFDESGCGADYEPQGGAGGDGDIRFRSPAQDYRDAPGAFFMVVR